MNGTIRDELWPYFEPLWRDLRSIDDKFLLIGGYALFLKHRWLISRPEVRTVIPLARWRDAAPRVTKDFDLIANIELIASIEDQSAVQAVLDRQGFAVVPDHARWQFEKSIGEGRDVVLEFNVVPPLAPRTDVRHDDRRVKPKPSLGDTGIHGHANPEATGCDIRPFSFVIDGVEVFIPNAASIAMMKMTAMRDRWQRAQKMNAGTARDFEQAQAEKHARDVYKAVAMVTREENDTMREVLDIIRALPVFSGAADIREEFFSDPNGTGVRMITDNWEQNDALGIGRMLADWFSKK
ncbi:MAG TPA: hypothetical protein P5077_08510 [bacterium]|nr:hypothetical protein [bacterium]